MIKLNEDTKYVLTTLFALAGLAQARRVLGGVILVVGATIAVSIFLIRWAWALS